MELIIDALFRHNTEKVVYFLLLDRKLRNPSKEDDEEVRAKSESGPHTTRGNYLDAACLNFLAH